VMSAAHRKPSLIFRQTERQVRGEMRRSTLDVVAFLQTERIDDRGGSRQTYPYGQHYIREIRRLRSAGYGSADISKKLGLPLRTVFTMYDA